MPLPPRVKLFCLFYLLSGILVSTAETLPGTQPLTVQGDLGTQMVEGIDRFLQQQTDSAPAGRQAFWHRDFSSTEAYEKSVDTNRARLRQIIGAVDQRLPVKDLELVGSAANPSRIGETDLFTVDAVRWPVFEGVFGEGLWIRPKSKTIAGVVAIPDADQTPEMLAGLAPGLAPERQFARRLAEHGCEVLVPVLIDRQATWSGNPRLKRFTNESHREWIYRQAYPLGRHIIGYEVEKVLAAVDWFEFQKLSAIGVAGYGEGGLIAFYAGALDTRIKSVLISGYFDSRQKLWSEPIYRNVFALLREFGDAEIAGLIAPRTLVVEYSETPKFSGPPIPSEVRKGAAPGRIEAADYVSVETEFDRAQELLKPGGTKYSDVLKLVTGTEGATTGPGSDRALAAFLNGLGVSIQQMKPSGRPLPERPGGFDVAARQKRQVKELEDYTQELLRESEGARKEFFWSKLKATSTQDWQSACAPFREAFSEEIIGRLPSPALPMNPRSRKVAEHPKWDEYEVMLDVLPNVFASGSLLLPKDIKPGERRSVVVCEHGLEGLPTDTFEQDEKAAVFRYFKGYAARLADQGYIVFAPQNPYRGKEKFRQLQRKANPLKLSLCSVIVAQNTRILDWLSSLPFVDANHIAFYGLSYGGLIAMRVPAILDRYAVTICSGNFNDWARKDAAVDLPDSYLYGGEYEMPEFNVANTFNYAEMAALIAPRPFMVERGMQDPTAQDEWVAYEYAKVRRLYDRLQIPDRTAIEFFHGGHTINGIGTFDFLQKNLGPVKP